MTYLSFEGRQFPVFSGYRHYLANLYGPDYMAIPQDPAILAQSHLKHMRIEFNGDPARTDKNAGEAPKMPEGADSL